MNEIAGRGTNDPAPQPGGARWRGVALSAPFVAICIAGLLLLGIDAARHIRALATANSDNIQWSTAQLEVEFAAFERALDGEAPPGAVRLAFDIFYSRFQTVSHGALYAAVVRSEARQDVAAVRTFLDETVPLIDGPDGGLIAALPLLRERAETVRPALRRISLAGVRVFSERSDRQRGFVLEGLVRITALAAGLVLALAIGVVALWRLMHIAREQASSRARAIHRLEAVVSTALDGIVVTNGVGRILEFNAAAQRITGHSRDSVIGERAEEILLPDGARGPSGPLVTSTGARRIRTTGCRADGTEFPAELAVTRSEQRGSALQVVYLRDITRRVTQERELVAARDQAVAGERAKARFLAVMSHEMRTPLNGLIGALELLDDTDLSPAQAEYLRILRRSGDILLAHVNDVLDLSRLETGNFTFAHQPFDPMDLVRDVAESLRPAAEARRISLSVDLSETLPPAVLGDLTRLRQVLINLVGNAVKFTEQGEVRIGLSYSGPQERLDLTVADTGIGIPEDQIARIFEDFVTLDFSYMRAAEGTGLGLGIARRLVEGMGGTITVQSAAGEGSLFAIRLPAPSAGEIAEAAPVPEPEPPPAGPARQVLLVEDNPVNRFVATAMLRKLGHEVTEAVDGAAGLEVAAQRRFDLILMDISMPRLDGVETTQRIREGGGPNARTPIVALTAHALPEDLARFRAAGMTQSLTKPITRRAVAALLAGDEEPSEETGPMAVLIDEETLAAAREALGPEVFATLQERFEAEMTAGLETTGELLGQGDGEAYAGGIHRLAGSAAVFGATALHAALREQEERARQGVEERVLTCAHKALHPLWSRTRQALRRPPG